MSVKNTVGRLVALHVLIAALFTAFEVKAAERQQILGAPADQEVDRTNTTIVAFCLEHNVLGFPDNSVPIPNATGRVWVKFLDPNRPPVEIDALDAAKGGLLAFYGAPRGKHYSATVKLGPGVERVRFLTPLALGQSEINLSPEAWKQIHEQATIFLGRVDTALTDSKNQARIHENRQLLLQEFEPGSKLRVHRTASYDPNRFMAASYFRLKSQGDASLIKSPGGQYVLHDLGASEEEMQQILDQVEPDASGIKRILVCITHADYDHYKGLTWLLEAQAKSGGKILVENIVVGVFPSKIAAFAANDDPSRFAKLVREIVKSYNVPDATKDYTHFVIKTGATTPLKLEVSVLEDGTTFARVDDMELEMLQFAGRMAMGAKTHRHAQNLVTRVGHKNFSIVDYSDAMPGHFREMLRGGSAEKAKSLELQAKLLNYQVQERRDWLEMLKESPAEIAKRAADVIGEFPANLRAKARALHSALLKAANLTLQTSPQEGLSELGESDPFRLASEIQDANPASAVLVLRLVTIAGIQAKIVTVDREQQLKAELAEMEKIMAQTEANIASLKSKAVQEDVNPNAAIMNGGTVTPKYPSFRAQVAKWPHHAWMPRSALEREIMKAWLKTYRPEILLINVAFDPEAPQKWKESRARVIEIEKLVEEARGEEKRNGRILPTEVLTTEEFGRKFQALGHLLEFLGLC